MKRYLPVASILLAVAILANAYGYPNADGAVPSGGVAVSGTTVFGTAFVGGANDYGTIWSFDTSSNTFTNLHDFSRAADGAFPQGGVAVSDLKVVGTASNHNGSIWSFDNSSNTFTNLHDFGGATDGTVHQGRVAVSGTTVFGTATVGGANNNGTIWSFDTSGNTFTKLHDFLRVADGSNPLGGVAVSGMTVMGTASRGGTNDDGTIWSFDTSNNTFTKLHDFNEVTDGHSPEGGVAVSGTTVVGAASSGGANDDGTIWSFDTSSDAFTKLHDFNAVADGHSPEGGVAVSGTTVFGTARLGGANGDGTIWSFDTSSDTFTKLHDLSRDADGTSPLGGVAVSGSTVFGTAWLGGANGAGTIWSFDSSTDTFTNLHSFSVPEPASVTLAAMCGLTLLFYPTRHRQRKR